MLLERPEGVLKDHQDTDVVCALTRRVCWLARGRSRQVFGRIEGEGFFGLARRRWLPCSVLMNPSSNLRSPLIPLYGMPPANGTKTPAMLPGV